MLSNSNLYKQRLMRLKSLGVDSQLTRVAAQGDSGSVGRTAGTSQFVKDKSPTEINTSLWMRQPGRRQQSSQRTPQQSSRTPESPSSTTTERPPSHLLDLQTNNSRRRTTHYNRSRNSGFLANSLNNATGGGGGGAASAGKMKRRDSSDEDSELAVPETGSTSSQEDPSNVNAVAKGANALVKQATSRPTEIIDTSKLLEEGKVETQYEEPEDEPEEIEDTDYKLIDEYEKTFAYARRLRALLNMKFNVLDPNSIETNFLLVKAHEHPTQKSLDRWRNVDLGNPYDSQIRQKKLVDDFKQSCSQKKKSKKGNTATPFYPEWIRFAFRFKKTEADKRWNDFMTFRRKMKKISGGKVQVPKATERYTAAFYDVWSSSVVVYSKPQSVVQDMVEPVFAKLGLEARADFKFTIGCFVGDKRSGKSKLPGVPAVAEEIAMQTMCSELYKQNCWEIFVNDNRVEMFKDFPQFYEADSKQDGDKASNKKDGKKAKKGKKENAKNQSNLGQGNNSQDGIWGADEGGCPSRYGDTTAATAAAACAKVSIVEETAVFDASPAATNQNLSVHDCDSSEDSVVTVPDGNTTTKSGRSDTRGRSDF